ncbi:MAG: HD domain-containing phosphohydrolase [Candidatus Eisenbacteria bacterium]
MLASRPAAEWQDVQGQVIRSDAGMAELLLALVRETTASRNDEARLLEVVTQSAFRAFPHATHHVLATRDPETGELRTRVAREKSGTTPQVAVSHTIAERVMTEGCAILFVHGQGHIDATASILLSRLETAICAPLMGNDRAFGVIQLDVRHPGKGRFTREDMDLLSVFASQAGLALEHLALHQQQRRAFQSTIHALVHSLSLKDPEAARHSERVQAVSVEIGRAMRLDDRELDVLSVAALLHDLGKQGVRDEVLFKPGKLTLEEREEVDRHAAHTQGILDMIEYPSELRDVPRIAAYHHEKLDGTGPLGIAGDDIPMAARIISVADVFDALLSPRVYKLPFAPEAVLDVLTRGKGVDWDARVVEIVAGQLLDLEAVAKGRIAPGSVEDEEESKAA